MKSECIEFLQWALPEMRMRWAGFRKVRNQVCKRIAKRIRLLGLSDFNAYKDYLSQNPLEWDHLDSYCRITISRFYRDWDVFDFLRDEILPGLAEEALAGKRPLMCWSAGCASGEEPYTLALLWDFEFKDRFSDLDFRIVATDIDEQLLTRARTACYPGGSLKGLPETWIQTAFTQVDSEYCLGEHDWNIQWLQQDIRTTIPEGGPFDLVLCRNLVATYFEPSLQVEIFNQIRSRMRTHAFLVLGCHEALPEGVEGFQLIAKKLNIFVKS